MWMHKCCHTQPPPTHTPSHHDVCLLLSPLRHAAKVVAGQQVDVVEPSVSQALQVRQAVGQPPLLSGVQVLPAEGAVLAPQVVWDRLVRGAVCVWWGGCFGGGVGEEQGDNR